MLTYSSILRCTVASLYYSLFGTIGDAVIIGVLSLWQDRLPAPIFALVGGPLGKRGAVAVCIALFAVRSLYRRSWQSDGEPQTWTGLCRPLLFPARTTHTRLFPEKHSFSYSYLHVGIPVGWRGVAGGMVAVEAKGQAWYTVDAADYLHRGRGHLGLRGKLDEYLESQGVDSAAYPHAYLLTAAKFLGYHFNPASFWYLYSAEMQLAAIIIEVNNTFDERRLYFLERGQDDDSSGNLVTTEKQETDAASTSADFNFGPIRRKWAKDFHVSPFNSRKGVYSVIAHDPLLPGKGNGQVDVTINLLSSKGYPKLVARLFSEGDALDPTQMSLVAQTSFLARWWWVGLVTSPRIIKEAGLLFFQRKLHVWYRPEPLKESIGRSADATEKKLEPIFRRYLRHLVKQSPAPLVVRYVPEGVPDALSEEMSSAAVEQSNGEVERTDFRVLTPAFYTRFVYYAHDLEAMFCELNENRTIWVSDPKLLPKLVFKKPPPPLQTASYTDYAFMSAIKQLRRRPERIERPLTSSQVASPAKQEDIRGFRLSSMDGYVFSQEDSKTRHTYRSEVLQLFVADRIALGDMRILWFEGLVLRILLAWFALP